MKILPFPSTIIIVFLDKQINTWQFFFMNSLQYDNIRPQQTGTRLRPSSIHSFMGTNQYLQVRYMYIAPTLLEFHP